VAVEHLLTIGEESCELSKIKAGNGFGSVGGIVSQAFGNDVFN
jgi:hypothetical protein